MLPKNNRITKNSFEELLKKGAVLHSPLFLFRFIKENVKSCNVVFVVSKKVLPGAVTRNKLRRRGYSAVRSIFKDTDPVPFAGIFFFKKRAGNMTFKEIKDNADDLFKRSGIIK